MSCNFFRFIATTGLLAIHCHAMAGSTDGLSILVVPSTSAQLHTSAIDRYFARYRLGGNGASCNDGLLSIANAEFAGVRHNISKHIGIDVVKDKDQRQRLRKALSSYRDASHPTGFDAALIVDARDGQLHLVGVSADSSEKLYSSAIPLASLASLERVKQAMCGALVMLPVLTPP